MSQCMRAANRLAASAVVALLVLWGSSVAGLSPASADDSAAWLGKVFKNTNMGQTAGIMYLAGPRQDRFSGRIAGDRHADRRKRHARRGTRVASLGDYAPADITSKRHTRSSKRHASRRTRLASLGNSYVSDDIGAKPRKHVAKRRAKHGRRVASLGNDIPASISGTQQKRRAKRHTSRRTRVASLGRQTSRTDFGPSLSGGSIRWAASAGCLNSSLRSVVASIASNFGAVTVNSTCRSRRHNARVGGARHSHHLTGNAVDFRVRGNWRGVWAFLRGNGMVGGLKHYGGGLFHIDTGPRRTW